MQEGAGSCGIRDDPLRTRRIVNFTFDGFATVPVRLHCVDASNRGSGDPSGEGRGPSLGDDRKTIMSRVSDVDQAWESKQTMESRRPPKWIRLPGWLAGRLGAWLAG